MTLSKKTVPVALAPREAYNLLKESAVIVDIRPGYETAYRVFSDYTAFVLPFNSYKEKYHDIPLNKTLIIVDSVGLKSPEVAQFFIEQGYMEVGYIAGGIVAWDRSGLPLSKDLGYELNGGCACKIAPKKSYE